MDPVLPLYFPFLLNPLQALAQENESKTAVVFKKMKKKKSVREVQVFNIPHWLSASNNLK